MLLVLSLTLYDDLSSVYAEGSPEGAEWCMAMSVACIFPMMMQCQICIHCLFHISQEDDTLALIILKL